MTATSCAMVQAHEARTGATYFDTIPAEACQNIVRNMSQRPRRQDWSRFLRAEDIKTLYNCEGQLTDACRTLFRSITVGNPGCCHGSSISHLQSDQLFVADDGDLSTFKSIIAPGGSSFQSLAILRTCTAESNSPLPQLIAEQCPAVERLFAECHYIGPRSFGPALRALSVVVLGPQDLPAIGNNCPQLRQLKLFRSWIDLTPIWKACGNRLEDVYFQVGTNFVEETIDGLQKYCRALKSIHIAGVELSFYFGRMARLYASYGEQLKHIVLPASITQDAIVCRQIAEACPLVRITMDDSEYHPAGMQYVGHLLRKASVVVFNHMDQDDLLHAWEYCSQLSDLNVKFHRGTSSEYHLLQELCRPTLLEMKIHGAVGNVGEVFSRMAERTGRLRRFVYEGDMPAIEALQTFIANNSALEQVDFSFVETDEFILDDGGLTEAEEDMEELMSAFAHTDILRELIIGRYPGIFKGERKDYVADACNFLRHRDVHVHVCGVNYLA